MDEARAWDVDRIAAGQLAAALGLSADCLEAVALAFARHRESTMEWTATQIRERIGQGLESAMFEQVRRRDEAWADGVAWAQMRVAGMGMAEMLGAVAGRPRSRGQVLRTMMRAARGDVAGARREA